MQFPEAFSMGDDQVSNLYVIGCFGALWNQLVWEMLAPMIVLVPTMR